MYVFLFVFEEIVDPFEFHEPADKIQIRFAVLDTVVPLSVGAIETVIKIGEAMVAKQLLDDIGNRHLLKDSAISGQAEKPEPWPKRGPIQGMSSLLSHESEFSTIGMEVPLFAVGKIQPNGEGLTEDV
jgi:hypothetical protein